MSDSDQNLLERIRDADLEAVERLLAEDPASAGARDESGVSAVMLALYHGRRDIAERIAGAKATLDLHEAAALGRRDRVEALISADPESLDARSPDGFTALHFAAFLGGPEIVKLLLEQGATVHLMAENPMRVQPLHSAAAAGQVDSVRALLAAGADPEARQQMGVSPLMSAAAGGHVEMIDVLLAAGADPAATSEDGKTARDYAVERGHPELADRLL